MARGLAGGTSREPPWARGGARRSSAGSGAGDTWWSCPGVGRWSVGTWRARNTTRARVLGEGVRPYGYFCPLWGPPEALPSTNPSACAGRHPGVAPGRQASAHLMPVCPRPTPELTASADSGLTKSPGEPRTGLQLPTEQHGLGGGESEGSRRLLLQQSMLAARWLHGLCVSSPVLIPAPRACGRPSRSEHRACHVGIPCEPLI